VARWKKYGKNHGKTHGKWWFLWWLNGGWMLVDVN
jgi:hypothetical protein